MSSETPNCMTCGKPYTIPGTFPANFGLCPDCRPIKCCEVCGGAGAVFTPSKTRPTFGKWSTCKACNGTRHNFRKQ